MAAHRVHFGYDCDIDTLTRSFERGTHAGQARSEHDHIMVQNHDRRVYPLVLRRGTRVASRLFAALDGVHASPAPACAVCRLCTGEAAVAPDLGFVQALIGSMMTCILSPTLM